MIIEAAKSTTLTSLTDHSTVLPPALSSVSNEITLIASLPACSPKDSHELDDLEIVETTRCLRPHTSDDIHLNNPVSSSSFTLPSPVNDLAVQSPPNQSPPTTCNASPSILETSSRIAGSTCASRSGESKRASTNIRPLPTLDLATPRRFADLSTEPLTLSEPLLTVSSSDLDSERTSRERAAAPSPSSLSAEYRTEHNLEECIISSSVEDHHYCSAVSNTSEEPSISCPTIAPSAATPISKTTKRSKSTKPAASKTSSGKKKPKPSTSSSSKCGKSTVTSNKSTSTRVTKAKAKAKAKTNVATANWSASLQIGNDCFKRFYLQRQVDGTFVIVPVGEPTTTTTSCNSSSSDKSSFASNPLKAAVPLTSGVPGCGQLVLLHEQSLKLQPVELMRIDKASLALDPAVSTHFSLADSSGSGQGKSTAETMSAQVNKSTPAFGSAMRSNGNNLHYQQSQSRAILSALKHDHLTSTAPVNQLTSPPPVVSSSSSSPVSQKLTMEEADTYPSFGPNGSSANSFLMSGNLLDQNMLVAALPPVETIFATERSSLANGPSLASLQQSEDNDLGMGHNFTSTTIIHDQHIDYYSHAVDSTVDDDDELLSNSKCLPFGYFYHDDDKVFDQLQLISSSLPSSTTSSPVLDGLNPLTDLFGSSVVKSEANGGFNSEEYDFANEMAFEFDNSGMQASSRARISPMAQTSAQSLMNCDSDPLISGNDVGNLNINSTKNAAFIQSMSLPSSGSTSAGMLHSAGKTLASNSFSSVNQLNSDSIFDSNQMLAEGNGDSFLIENGHSYSCSKQKGSPMINRDTPTLAQLNLQLPIKEEEEEMINWPNGLQNNGFAHTLPCNGMDLNGQQQNNIISSTSSPTVKSSPLVDTNDNKFWFSQNNVPMNDSGSLGNVSTGSANNVTSSLEELMVPEMDDGSLEIEAILQHSQAPLSSSFSGSSGLYSGSQHNLVSPPKLSSSLPMSSFKSPLVQKQKIKRPNFVLPQRNGDKGTLLSELLLSNNSNVNDILRTNGSMVINVNNSQLNLVQKQPNQMSALNGSSQNAFPNYSPKGSRGKSMFNYPTLTALITSPNLNINNSPMLSSAALLPPISNLTSGPSMATILANNNRNRNNSMSTDYSVSSHDEGFASQPEEESESDDNSEEMMLMADTNEDLIDDMFFIETAVTPNDNSATVDCQQQQMSQQDLLTHSDASLVNAMANAVTQSELDLLGPVKQEEEPMWCPATQPLPTVNQQSIKSEGQYQPSKASTSSAIDDNESADEDEEDDDDESFYGDYDASDLLGATTSDDINNKWSLNMGRSRKGSEKRFFWQYNVQSKGPKGPRFNGAANSSFEEEEDPHVFNEISDPVFAPDCQVEGVKHSGKARRGDGNDLTPNPKKLLMIGLELKKLSRTINDLTPVTEVPFTCRNKSRKEKNKLASRACRLKKKAQHEANKIKLHGLHREHAKMVKAISEMRKVVELGRKMIDNGNKPVYVPLDGVTYQLASVANLDSLMEEVHGRHKAQMEIAGRTADFVNHILDNVSSGIANGGIECV